MSKTTRVGDGACEGGGAGGLGDEVLLLEEAPHRGQDGVVVAHAEDPARSHHVRTRGEVGQFRDQLVDRLDGSVGRRQQLSSDGLDAEVCDVRMTVDEPRSQRAPGEIDHARARGAQRHDL